MLLCGLELEFTIFIKQKKINKNVQSIILDFVKMLANSIFTNLLKAGIMSAVAYSCSWWLTILIALLLGLFLDNVYQQAIDTGRFFLKALMDGIRAVPYCLGSMFVTTSQQNGDVPMSLTCCISYALLEDPVYVQGQFMSRRNAEQHLQNRLRGPSGDVVEAKHIMECPEIQSLVAHYNKLY